MVSAGLVPVEDTAFVVPGNATSLVPGSDTGFDIVPGKAPLPLLIQGKETVFVVLGIGTTFVVPGRDTGFVVVPGNATLLMVSTGLEVGRETIVEETVGPSGDVFVVLSARGTKLVCGVDIALAVSVS